MSETDKTELMLKSLIAQLRNQVKTIEMIEASAQQTDFSYGEKTGLLLAIKIAETMLDLKTWRYL